MTVQLSTESFEEIFEVVRHVQRRLIALAGSNYSLQSRTALDCNWYEQSIQNDQNKHCKSGSLEFFDFGVIKHILEP